MTDYDNSNSAALFKNEDKEEGSNHPDYKGFGEVNGKKVDIAAWIRTAKKTGQKFMSLKFQAPRRQQAGDDDTGPRGKRNDDDGFDVPF